MSTDAEVEHRLHTWTTTATDGMHMNGKGDGDDDDGEDAAWIALDRTRYERDLLWDEVEYYKKILSSITSLRTMELAARGGGGRVATQDDGLNVEFTLDILDVLDEQAREIKDLREDKARLETKVVDLEEERHCWEMSMVGINGGPHGSSLHARETSETDMEEIQLTNAGVTEKQASMPQPPITAHDIIDNHPTTTTSTTTTGDRQAAGFIRDRLYGMEFDILAEQSQINEDLFNTVFLVMNTPYKHELQDAQGHVQAAPVAREGCARRFDEQHGPEATSRRNQGSAGAGRETEDEEGRVSMDVGDA